MSINIVVGSDPADHTKLRQTIDILKFVNKTENKNEFDIHSQSLEELIDWYDSMYNILTNPNLFTEEV